MRITIIAITGVALALGMCAAKAGTVSPSFECKKATTDTEREICKHDFLAEEDVALSKTYHESISLIDRYWQARYATQETGIGALRDEQERWLVSRNGCKGDWKCIDKAIQVRIDNLQAFNFQLLHDGNKNQIKFPLYFNLHEPVTISYDNMGHTAKLSESFVYDAKKASFEDGKYLLKFVDTETGKSAIITIPLPEFVLGGWQQSGNKTAYLGGDAPTLFLWSDGAQGNDAPATPGKSAYYEVKGVSSYVRSIASHRILHQQKGVTDALEAIEGVRGTLLGVVLDTNGGACAHGCSSSGLYLFLISDNLQIKPMLFLDWDQYTGGSEGNNTVTNNAIELFVEKSEYPILHLDYTSIEDDLYMDSSEPDPCDQMKSQRTIRLLHDEFKNGKIVHVEGTLGEARNNALSLSNRTLEKVKVDYSAATPTNGS